MNWPVIQNSVERNEAFTKKIRKKKWERKKEGRKKKGRKKRIMNRWQTSGGRVPPCASFPCLLMFFCSCLKKGVREERDQKENREDEYRSANCCFIAFGVNSSKSAFTRLLWRELKFWNGIPSYTIDSHKPGLQACGHSFVPRNQTWEIFQADVNDLMKTQFWYGVKI